MTERLHLCLGVGLAAGLAIAYVDNIAFDGEVSPTIIVGMLLAATATMAARWGRRGWTGGALAWACVPTAHLIKHAFRLPDTLHPNSYRSILYLAAFTLAVSIVGAGCGAVLHDLLGGAAHDDSEST